MLRGGPEPQEEQVEMGVQEEQEKQEKEREWGTKEREKEKDQALVVVMYDTDVTDEKPKSFSSQRQSSTEESHHCSARTEPEPSTEQSSGTEQVHKLQQDIEDTVNHITADTKSYFQYYSIFLINQLNNYPIQIYI